MAKKFDKEPIQKSTQINYAASSKIQIKFVIIL